ncbi:Nrap protein [Trametes versicolor FP-101664 SS1]|uniref:Nrap protein n=1 Tax=Trametes versicolor (strain FP-101664) TaxID=717944 RepID=UPI0004621890|nr:Nrap protein [Trametes versicolor FP-101664 SS1]EIW56105.1 Nrap protein [Trametes versicolor FP-101664 SS1]
MGSGSDQDAEEEAWGGIQAAAAHSHENSAEAGPSGSHILKPPTGEELKKIKDASELFRSTAFKSQVHRRNAPQRPSKYDKSQSLDALLLSIHKLLMELPAIAPQHPLHASRTLSKQGIDVPYVRPLPTEETNWKVSFEKPSEIMLAGSWITKTAVKAKDFAPFTADLAIEMPSNLFQEKDYLNSRVFQKRAYYLGVVASAIAKAKFTLRCELFYESISGDPRRTCLVLRPEPDGSHKSSGKVPIHVRIIPFISESPIPLQRLSPARSNIRATTLKDESKEEPTPLYNTAYMLMTTPRAHLLHVHALAKNVPSFVDALTLLRVWANQRGYGLGSRMCVRGFEGKGIWWASILDLIVNGEEPPPAGLGKRGARRKPLGKGLSSYQLFKAALDFLGMIPSTLGTFPRHNFGEEAVFVKSKDGHRFPPSSYSSHEAVFVDATSSVNLLADVPLASLDTLRYDAQSTLELLDHASISEDTFAPLFLQEHRDILARFDVVARVDLSSVEMRTVSAQHVADHGSAYSAAVAQLVSTLRRGFGDRAKAIAVLHASSDVRPTSQALPIQSSIVHVGIILDSEHAFRLVDHGPPAEEQESERTRQFRQFWGDKAELRRFKDGSIAESVVWDVKNADERARIPAMIMRHLLARHFGLGADAVQTWQTEFDALLKLPESISSLYQASSASVGFKSALLAALDEQFPLAVLNVSPVTPALRYTDVFVPATLAIPSRSALPKRASYLPVMEIIIEFEKSARWPDDLHAIQKMKLAFFERLASILMHAVKGLQATVVFGERPERTEIEDEAALDIITADGWAFRARIWHDREATLLDRIINDQPHVPKALRQAKTGEDARDRQLALHARELYTRRFIHAPRHHRAIAALYHRFPAFANTVRLTKRWFAAHWLLHGHVSEEAVELLCAHVFLRTGPPFVADAAANAKTFAPGWKERGFAQVIEFLKDWDWTGGLEISLDNADQTAGDSSTAPPTTTSKDVAWALKTPFDPRGHMWTSSGPNAVVARRITTIAKATWECLNGLETGASTVKAIFHHPTDYYDFVIELNPALSTRYHQKLDADPSVWAPKGKYANAIVKGAAASIMPSFDPFAMFYGDLSHVYADTVLLFHDPLGGDRIGAVWQPNLRSARPFRALGGFSSIPSQKRLGSTLVAKIVPRDT